MSEGPVKRVKVYSHPVHFLDLDGELTVHMTRDGAIRQYLSEWARYMNQKDIVERVDKSLLGSDEKNAIKDALLNGVIPKEEDLDFQVYLEECEDVCHYEVLQMKL